MTLLKFQRKLCPFNDRDRERPSGLQSASFSEFRSNRSEPPSDSVGQPGDVFFNTRVLSLHIRLEGSKGWSKAWDGSFKNRLAHPLYEDQYLWIIGERKLAGTKLRLEFCPTVVILKNLFFVSSGCSIFSSHDYQRIFSIAFPDLLRSLKISLPNRIEISSSQSYSGKRQRLADHNHVQVNEPCIQSRIIVTSDLQTSWCKIQLCLHSSFPSASSASSLDDSQLRAHVDFKSPIAGHDLKLSFSFNAGNPHVAPLDQQPDSQQVLAATETATATAPVIISDSDSDDQTELNPGDEIMNITGEAAQALRGHSRWGRLKGKTMMGSTSLPTTSTKPKASTTNRLNSDNSTSSSFVQLSSQSERNQLNPSNWSSTAAPKRTGGKPYDTDMWMSWNAHTLYSTGHGISTWAP